MKYYYYTAIKTGRPVSERTRGEHLSTAINELDNLGYTDVTVVASEPIEDGAPLTPRGLIYAYDITLATDLIPGKGFVPNGKLRIGRGANAKRDGNWDAIVASKPEIIEILTDDADAQRRATAKRQAKIDAIPGLSEIRAAMADLAAWRAEFERSFDDCGGLGVRPRPQYDMDALYKAYPRAAAYLEAESMANASHYAKAAAGQRALERIINGEDAAAALSDARAEWGAHAVDHMWD